jgi:hypothetical protein
VTRKQRRNRGVFERRDPAHPSVRFVNDGGTDEPLTPRGRFIYRAVLLGILAAFTALLAVTVATR